MLYCTMEGVNMSKKIIIPKTISQLKKKYIGRKIIKSRYDEYFSSGSYSFDDGSDFDLTYTYFKDSEWTYEEAGVSVYLTPKVDDNGIILDLECSKSVETTPGPRPVGYYTKCDKNDIRMFSKLLNYVSKKQVSKQKRKATSNKK